MLTLTRPLAISTLQKRYPPKDFPLPPDGCTNEPAVELIKRINEAAQSFPDWDSHTRLKRAAAAQVS